MHHAPCTMHHAPCDLASTRSNSNRSGNDTSVMVKGKKLGHRRVKDGEVTYKKFETTPLMRSIQVRLAGNIY